jgi:hypothetical protein
MRVRVSLVVLAVLSCSCASSYEYLPEPEEGEAAYVPYEELPLIITVSPRLSRPAEVLAILDVHVRDADQDRALEELARQAADIGADAVVGVEFHHGASGPSHLSGLAVRVLR